MGPGALGGTGENAATAAQIEAKYGPAIDHGGTTHRFIIVHEGAAIGLIQWYHLRDFADYARAIGEDPAATGVGIDLLIGEPDAIGRGLDHTFEGSYAQAGAEFCKRNGERDEIVHAIRAHNDEKLHKHGTSTIKHGRGSVLSFGMTTCVM